VRVSWIFSFQRFCFKDKSRGESVTAGPDAGQTARLGYGLQALKTKGFRIKNTNGTTQQVRLLSDYSSSPELLSIHIIC
jgi:hypothetical protein